MSADIYRQAWQPFATHVCKQCTELQLLLSRHAASCSLLMLLTRLEACRSATPGPPCSFGIVLWEITTGEVPTRGAMRNPKVPEECPQVGLTRLLTPTPCCPCCLWGCAVRRGAVQVSCMHVCVRVWR